MKRIVQITESQLTDLIKKVINEQISSAPLLRTMTYKSKFNFGKYNNQTVGEVLRIGKKHYIRYVYYNLDGISFTDEILKDVGIIGDDFDHRIKKPGTDPELGQEISKEVIRKLPLKAKSHYKRMGKSAAVGKKISDNLAFSKGILQAKNQGKK